MPKTMATVTSTSAAFSQQCASNTSIKNNHAGSGKLITHKAGVLIQSAAKPIELIKNSMPKKIMDKNLGIIVKVNSWVIRFFPFLKVF